MEQPTELGTVYRAGASGQPIELHVRPVEQPIELGPVEQPGVEPGPGPVLGTHLSLHVQTNSLLSQ